MTLFKTFAMLIVAIMLSSCNSTKLTTATYWVNSAKVDCDAGAGKAQCLKMTKADDYENADWELFYAPIEGFIFEPGYLQKIKVSETELDLKDVPADASSIKYTLIEVLEKKQDPKLAIHDIWVTTHINGEKIDTTDVPTLEINTTKMQIFGTNGCNHYNGSIKTLNSKSIDFHNIAATLKMCADMTIPDRFDKALTEASSYKKDGLTLTIYDKGGDELLRFKKVD